MARGDFDKGKWGFALAETVDNWNEYTAYYLVDHPMLADYLTEGLNLLGYSHESSGRRDLCLFSWDAEGMPNMGPMSVFAVAN